MNQFSLPSNAMDPCSIGPLTCGPTDCHGIVDDDEETATLFTTASRKSRSSLGTFRTYASYTTAGTVDSASNPLAELKERVSDFQSRGWLSQQEHRKYMALLDTAPSPKEDDSVVTDFVQKDLIRELDELEEKMSGGTMLKKQTRLAVMTPKAPLPTPASENKNVLQPFQETTARKTMPLSSFTNKMNNQKTSSILEAKDLSKQLSESQISELFVETCFFARLGFVQPPCCLQCTYRESLKEDIPNDKCGRWVVWRRDAQHILHPKLLDNAFVIQCYAARKLLNGKLVDSHKWDTVNKVILVPPRLMKGFKS